MLYSKIVVAYDGSETSEKALDSALKIAKSNHFSKLHIIHVSNVTTYVLGEAIYVPQALDYSDEVIAKIKSKIGDHSDVHIEVRSGSIAKEILHYAGEVNADLIVIGSRGLNGLGEFVLGSVSHNVAQHAKVPVLIIK
ncbi:universal stress protein [Paenibacillus sp. HB172176]|uniref:universal stress protein n=1 Tax=Paenibacillus sp. HB172176 TaxID=2493690 RepID=UPI001439A670|nr:universal stress protein [Paenibacillus sp. HB172176]